MNIKIDLVNTAYLICGKGDPRGRLAVPSWTRLVNDLLPNPFSPSITEKAQNTAQDRGYDKIKYDKRL